MRIESRHCCAFSRPAGVGMPARFLVFLISATYVFLEAGCAHRMVIVPAATATAISGRKYAAEGHDAGVQIMADGNDWWGYPLDLPRIVTPMQVSIKNDSGKSLRIRYKDDSLVTSSGSVYYPLPPYRIRGEVTSAEPVTPAFAYNRFLIVPGYAPFYRWDFDDWGGPFDFDWDYYPTYYRVWGVHLPTRDMIRHAIPEGVLENGGRLSGFLYFPKVDRRHQEEGLKFSIDLVDASTQEHIGQITIPFEIRPSTER